ncbi:sialate O-acetylesterase [Sphingobacterium sp. BIGb0165]|uniref:sialate O-acetylesterase n=1 Tax=Sphingobacterium sp. BIGb0165 TaxID=2940615 RepID=UPI002169FB32|nr:sialate O-acetylesterase [Sphingobacterium sp. BIGb0165]MCS4225758.1 mutator protein MutT [Sphingobacterium sp. BIGb0165]
MLQVTCAIIQHANKILICQRSASMKLPLKWEFPGGKIEAEESKEDCLLREIKEELNIDINIHKALTMVEHHYAEFSLQLYPFVCSLLSDEVDALEHAQAIWVDAAQLKNYDWAEADLPIVDEYLNGQQDNNKDMVHSFLMVGQSNMAGRGFLNQAPLLFDERIKMLRNGSWQMMWEPINCDRPTSGISLVSSFAAAWLEENPDREIGLIPCADGGSSLDDWRTDGPLFKNAVFQAKLAMENSSLDGILWHQGENDSLMGRSKQYAEKLKNIVDAFRNALDAADISFISGGLGDFLPFGQYGQYFTESREVNEALLGFTENSDNCYFVSASKLNSNPDGLHFDAPSLRKFGLRYFQAFHRQTNILGALDNEEETVQRLEQRPLTAAEKKTVLEIRYASGLLSQHEYEKQSQHLER